MQQGEGGQARFHAPDTQLFLLAGASGAEVRDGARGLLAQANGAALPDRTATSIAHGAAPRGAGRAAIVAGTPVELRQKLEILDALIATHDGDGVARDPSASVWYTPPVARPGARVGFLFPG